MYEKSTANPSSLNPMKLKEKLKEEPGFQYVIDEMQLMSAVGRRMLLDQEFSCDSSALNAEFDRIEHLMAIIADESNRKPLFDFRHRLMELQDILTTIQHVQHRVVLDEIELFELKTLASISLTARRFAAQLGIDALCPIPDLTPVFEILDPDGTKIPNFYIYDSYDPRLAPLRRQLKGRQTHLETSGDSLTEEELTLLNAEIADLFTQQNAVEREVIVTLTGRLHPYGQLLEETLSQMGYADLLLAKAYLARELGLTRPVLLASGSAAQTHYRSLFNPRLRHHNEERRLRYQPIDVDLRPGLCLITGANMAGKTVALKTLGTAQVMAQFGMFVPAQEAQVMLVEDVVFCIGDEQNEMNGLSSYASEIIKISNALRRTATQTLMVLIDEPARTTNPIEGKAIVQAVGSLLNSRQSLSVITTHYSQLGLDCHRLRVKGFMEEMVDTTLTAQNINQFMDYSLLEDASEEVPHEALRIASILGCDDAMITLAQQFAEGK